MGRRTKLVLIVLLILLLLFILLLLIASVRDKRAGRKWFFQRWSRQEQTQNPSDIASNGGKLVKQISVFVDKIGGRVDWSWKNNLVAFSQLGPDGYTDVYTMNPDKSGKVCLTCGKSAVPQLSNDQPDWHPNGKYIVFQSQDPNLKALPKSLTQGGAGLNNNLWVTTSDGTEFYQLTKVKTSEASLHPHFSHDGEKLFWAARVVPAFGKGYWTLKIADFVVGPSGPELTNEKEYRPLRGFGFYESHDFSLDNKTIFFSASKSEFEYDLDIYSMNLQTSAVKNLTGTSGVWDEHSILSPSGKKLVWISSQGYDFQPDVNWGATLKTDLWIMNTDGSNKQKVTHFNQSGYSESNSSRVILADSSWSPDGTKLVVASFVEGVGTRIWLVEFKEPQ